MIADIALHREELRDLCRRFHVRRLEVFGSAARGDFDPARSDIDFLVEFAEDDTILRALSTSSRRWKACWRGVSTCRSQGDESSRNYIRKRHILTGAKPVYAA